MKRIVLLLTLSLFSTCIFAQSSQEQKVRDLISDAEKNEPAAAVVLYEKAIELAQKIKFGEGIYQITEELTTLYEQQGAFTKAAELYKQGIAYAESQEDLEKEARYHANLGIVEYYLGNWEQSIERFSLALELNKRLGKTEKVADGYANLGNLYQMNGKHIQSVDHYLKALEIFEEIGLQNGIGTTLYNLGSLYNEWSEDSLAYRYFRFAEEVFRQEKDSSSLGPTLTSKAIILFDQKKLDSAELALDEALRIFQDISEAHGTMHTYYKLGALYIYQQKYDKAEKVLDLSLAMAEKQNNEQHICWNLLEKALVEKARKHPNLALNHIQEAHAMALKLNMEKFVFKTLEIESEIYAESGRYRESLETYKASVVLRDSMFNEEKNRQIAELRTVYETEKKDKEIALLEKNAVIARLKNSAMGVGLGAVLLIGMLLFRQQRTKRQKDHQIFEQQKTLQEEQVKIARMERVQMAQELNTQVLNFCRKNEFLQSLKSEISDFQQKPQPDQIRKLIRKIDLDLKGDTDWESFLQSFSQVHPGFTYSLTQRYNNITSNEIRLASLMRMNLSGKEIAAMLNVSVDSVKKARHRLRKKLALDSEINLQDFLLRI